MNEEATPSPACAPSVPVAPSGATEPGVSAFPADGPGASRPATRRQRRDAERAAERAAAERAVEQAEAERAADRAEAGRAAEKAQAERAVGGVLARPEPEPFAGGAPDSPDGVGRESLLGGRTPLGVGARLAVLVLLAAVTVIAPLSSGVTVLPGAAARQALALPAAASTTGPSGSQSASPTALPSSVAAAVLGSDADVDDSSADDSLANVPDAATLARIREAYANASVTCAAQSFGASGDTAAFASKPEVLMPMVEGTYTVSSPYGYRIHPTLGVLKLHAGQDFSAAVGTPIYAAAAGTVVDAGMVDGTGTVTIRHTIDGKTWYTSYLHMFEDGIYVAKGDEVEAGQLIAGVGSTGRSTGPHLHFEVRTKDDGEDSSTVEPAAWLTDHHAADLSTDCS